MIEGGRKRGDSDSRAKNPKAKDSPEDKIDPRDSIAANQRDHPKKAKLPDFIRDMSKSDQRGNRAIKEMKDQYNAERGPE